MKIAFTGAHGTGKSTLVHHPFFKEEFPNYTIYDSVVRKYHNPITKSDQFKINCTYVYKHFTTKNFISARSIFDPWAYSRNTIGWGFNLRLFKWAINHIHYDHLFYVPLEFELHDDGFRPMKKSYQEKIDQDIKVILTYLNIEYTTISGTVEERIEQIKDRIND